MKIVRGGPGGRLRTKRSSIEKEEMSLSYQAMKPVRFGMMDGGVRKGGRRVNTVDAEVRDW